MTLVWSYLSYQSPAVSGDTLAAYVEFDAEPSEPHAEAVISAARASEHPALLDWAAGHVLDTLGRHERALKLRREVLENGGIPRWHGRAYAGILNRIAASLDHLERTEEAAETRKEASRYFPADDKGVSDLEPLSAEDHARLLALGDFDVAGNYCLRFLDRAAAALRRERQDIAWLCLETNRVDLDDDEDINDALPGFPLWDMHEFRYDRRFAVRLGLTVEKLPGAVAVKKKWRSRKPSVFNGAELARINWIDDVFAKKKTRDTEALETALWDPYRSVRAAAATALGVDHPLVRIYLDEFGDLRPRFTHLQGMNGREIKRLDKLVASLDSGG